MTWKPGTPLWLETPNYRLRSMGEGDVSDAVVRWFADPAVMEYVALPMSMERAAIVRMVKEADNAGFFMLAIEARETGPLIGFYRVWRFPVYRYAKTAVLIGDRDYWGSKAVLETRAALLDFLFEEAKLHKVTGAVYTRNVAAAFNYKAQGFACEGVLRQQEPDRRGGWRDVYLFGLLRDEWQARKAGAQR